MYFYNIDITNITNIINTNITNIINTNIINTNITNIINSIFIIFVFIVFWYYGVDNFTCLLKIF